MTALAAIIGTVVAVALSATAALLKIHAQRRREPSATLRVDGRTYKISAGDAQRILAQTGRREAH